MKFLEVRQKYSAARRIFNSLLGVSSGDETLNLMLDVIPEAQDGKDVPLPLFKHFLWVSLRRTFRAGTHGVCTEGGWDCATFEFHFILLLIRRWTKSCTLTQSFLSGLTGLLVFSSSIEFPFFLQLGVTSHYNPVVNMKPLTHYSMLLYKQLPRETGQVSSGEGGRGVFLIFALPYRYLPPQRVWVCTVLVWERI